MAGSSASEDFSVVVLASDLGVDARPFLSPAEAAAEQENWHDCPSLLTPADDFSDLEALQFFRRESGSDKSGYPIFRIVGKYFPALVIPGERLKKYVFHKILTEIPVGPYCIVYIHSTVRKDDNSPGITILRWIYEELPSDCKDRLQVVYFIHPGLRSRLVFATLGRFLLSGGSRDPWRVVEEVCVLTEIPVGPYCIVYIHSTVQKDDTSPGITILRWIYEELPSDCKDRLQAVYFIHPGLMSRLVFATLGRFLLSGGLRFFCNVFPQEI